MFLAVSGRRRQGFTLVEILVVLSLFAVLMGLGIGLIQRAGTGNLLTQTTSSMANLLATARAGAFGSATAYVTVDSVKQGGGTLRVFRQRPVLTWHCEDFESASEQEIIKQEGAVEVAQNAAVPSMAGRHLVFAAGGRVIIDDRPWLQFVDGFSIECRLLISPDTSKQRMRLFRKGTALDIAVVGGPVGRYDIEAKIRLDKDEEGKGGGIYQVRTGERGPEEVVEWKGSILPGRWYDVRVAYDRNEFTIQINGALRGLRTGKTNAMLPDFSDSKTDLVIGDGYQGGFDSLLIGGIYEDDDDRNDYADVVFRIDPEGKPIEGREFVHFRNRQLDPQHHTEAIEMQFRLGTDDGGVKAPRRIVSVGLSGETFVKRPGE
ncbi:MAG: prepilin-type N-terminal cleavage/methylation domain-containing protein [Planctomycetota bacterium]